MKRLTGARFFRVDQEEERMFVLFGPVTKPQKNCYVFNDSIRPQRFSSFTIEEGKQMQERQLVEPVLVYEEGKERVYWFQHRYLLCSLAEEGPEAVKAWVLANDDRRAKREAKKAKLEG